MIYLTPASTDDVRAAMRRGLLGLILGVNAGNRLEPGVPTGLDNGCFPDGWRSSTWNEAKWWRFIERRTNVDTLFVVCPDMPGDAEGTVAGFERYADSIDGPVAFATQNGCRDEHVPWDRIDCLFTGGDDRWKLGEDARLLMEKAKRLGKWTHMGRVNTLPRLTIAARHGYDSVDGTYIAFGPDTNLPKMLAKLRTVERLADHPTLEGIAR